LDGGLDIPNALQCDPVLVVPIDILVLQLANLVEENAKLVGDVRDVLVARLAPERELLLLSGQHPDSLAL